jgi:hypothetical protein
MNHASESLVSAFDDKPAQCELHEELKDRNRYVCNLSWPALRSLRMDRFPKDIVLHLQTGDGRDSGDVDSRIASIDLNDLEVSADQVLYHVVQNAPRDWLDFVWRSISLAGWWIIR